MDRYLVTGVERSGSQRTLELAADSADEAAKLAREQGVFPTAIRPGKLGVSAFPVRQPVAAQPSNTAPHPWNPIFTLIICIGLFALIAIALLALNTSSSPSQDSGSGYAANSVDDASELQSFRSSLERHLEECNARIPALEARHTEQPISLTPGRLDVVETNSVLNPFAGVLSISVTNSSGRRIGQGFRYEFTVNQNAIGEWEFVRCYGVPTNGTPSEWSLSDLAYQYQGRIAMSWLLGQSRSRSLLESAIGR